jgi:hypothetical protein
MRTKIIALRNHSITGRALAGGLGHWRAGRTHEAVLQIARGGGFQFARVV